MEKAPAQREREVAAIALLRIYGRPGPIRKSVTNRRDRSQQIEMTTDFRFE
jgi:hypothetical protein